MKKVIVGTNGVLTSNGKVLYKEDETLPQGYTKLQYVTLSNFRVDTGEKTTEESVVETKIYISSTTATYLWYSDSNSSGTTNTTAYSSSGGGNWRFDGATVSIVSSVFRGDVHVIKQNNSGVFMDGTSIGTYSNVGTFTSSSNLLFGPSASVSVNYYYFKHVKDGEVVSYYIPCLNPDNTAGFYDLVKETFTAGGTAGPTES